MELGELSEPQSTQTLALGPDNTYCLVILSSAGTHTSVTRSARRNSNSNSNSKLDNYSIPSAEYALQVIKLVMNVFSLFRVSELNTMSSIECDADVYIVNQ